MDRLNNISESESKSEQEIFEKSKPISDFNREFGNALCAPIPESLSKNWQGKECVFDLVFDGKTFRACGTYEQPVGGILGLSLFGINQAENTRPKVQKNHIVYEGIVRGKTVIGTVLRKQEEENASAASTLLGGATEKPIFLLRISEDRKKFYVLERTNNKLSKFYQLTAV